MSISSPKRIPPDADDIQNGKFCYFKFLSKEIGIKIYDKLPLFSFSRNYTFVHLDTINKFWEINKFSFFIRLKDLETFEKYKERLILDKLNKLKQVIVIRKDLKMRRGKEISQGCHASQLAIEEAKVKNESLYKKWVEDKFTKICVTVDSEEQLLEIYKLAKETLLPCSLVCDSGLTEFDGVSTFTAVGIGPAWSEEIDKITGNLKLY